VVFSLSTDTVVTQISSHELSRTRQARRDHLLETAQTGFLRDGYNATTMEGIALAAGVSKATLYKYFSDKDELFLSLVRERRLAPNQRLMDDLHRTLQQTMLRLKRRGSQAEVAAAILQLLKSAAERRSDVFYRMLVEIAFAQPELGHRVRQELMAYKPHDFLAWAEQATADLPPEIDGRALLHLFFVAITGYSVIEDAVFGDERIEPERLAGTFAALICSAIK
jgi:AcrR family transcriptional regulator